MRVSETLSAINIYTLPSRTPAHTHTHVYTHSKVERATHRSGAVLSLVHVSRAVAAPMGQRRLLASFPHFWQTAARH